MTVICDRHKWERGTRKTVLYIALREFQLIRPSPIKSDLVGDWSDTIPTLDGSDQHGRPLACEAFYLRIAVLLAYHDRHRLSQPIRSRHTRLSTGELHVMPQLRAKGHHSTYFAIEQWLQGDGRRVGASVGQHSALMAATTFPLASSWQLSVRRFPVAFFSAAIESVSQASGRGRQRPGWIFAGITPF